MRSALAVHACRDAELCILIHVHESIIFSGFTNARWSKSSWLCTRAGSPLILILTRCLPACAFMCNWNFTQCVGRSSRCHSGIPFGDVVFVESRFYQFLSVLPSSRQRHILRLCGRNYQSRGTRHKTDCVSSLLFFAFLLSSYFVICF